MGWGRHSPFNLQLLNCRYGLGCTMLMAILYRALWVMAVLPASNHLPTNFSPESCCFLFYAEPTSCGEFQKFSHFLPEDRSLRLQQWYNFTAKCPCLLDMASTKLRAEWCAMHDWPIHQPLWIHCTVSATVWCGYHVIFELPLLSDSPPYSLNIHQI